MKKKTDENFIMKSNFDYEKGDLYTIKNNVFFSKNSK